MNAQPDSLVLDGMNVAGRADARIDRIQVAPAIFDADSLYLGITEASGKQTGIFLSPESVALLRKFIDGNVAYPHLADEDSIDGFDKDTLPVEGTLVYVTGDRDGTRPLPRARHPVHVIDSEYLIDGSYEVETLTPDPDGDYLTQWVGSSDLSLTPYDVGSRVSIMGTHEGTVVAVLGSPIPGVPFYEVAVDDFDFPEACSKTVPGAGIFIGLFMKPLAQD